MKNQDSKSSGGVRRAEQLRDEARHAAAPMTPSKEMAMASGLAADNTAEFLSGGRKRQAPNGASAPANIRALLDGAGTDPHRPENLSNSNTLGNDSGLTGVPH